MYNIGMDFISLFVQFPGSLNPSKAFRFQDLWSDALQQQPLTSSTAKAMADVDSLEATTTLALWLFEI